MFKGLPPRQIELLSSAIAEQTVLHGFMMDSWFTSSLCWIPESSWAGAMDFPWIFPRAAVQPNRTQCLTLDVLCRYQLERRPDWYIRWDATNDAGIGSWYYFLCVDEYFSTSMTAPKNSHMFRCFPAFLLELSFRITMDGARWWRRASFQLRSTSFEQAQSQMRVRTIRQRSSIVALQAPWRSKKIRKSLVQVAWILMTDSHESHES